MRSALRVAAIPAALLGASALAGCADSSEGGSPERTQTVAATATAATVRRVNDGDTLTLTDGTQVRLVQIDAPELGTDCYGRSARAALARHVAPGSRVVLDRDVQLDDRDRYGRLLRYVLVGGTNVNVALVREGAASPYFFRKQRGAFARDLVAAAEEAQRRRRGLWGACPAAAFEPYRGSVTGPA